MKKWVDRNVYEKFITIGAITFICLLILENVPGK